MASSKPIVGLTGGIGSGKTTVSDIFTRFGIEIIDTDVISRQLTLLGGEALPAIHKVFGNKVFLPDGSLDRLSMRELIYFHESNRSKLEQILHPLIFKQSLLQLEQVQSVYGILVVPLLFETRRFLSLVNRTLLIDCETEIQIKRILLRDNTSVEQAQAILLTQLPREEKIKLADDIIVNHSDYDDLLEQVEQLHQHYLSLFR